MGSGYGNVQCGCLTAIGEAERKGAPPPTTFDIAVRTYRIHAPTHRAQTDGSRT